MAIIELLAPMQGREGQKIDLLVNGYVVTRRVYYRKHEGLFVIIKGYKIFDYDFYASGTFDTDLF